MNDLLKAVGRFLEEAKKPDPKLVSTAYLDALLDLFEVYEDTLRLLADNEINIKEE